VTAPASATVLERVRTIAEYRARNARADEPTWHRCDGVDGDPEIEQAYREGWAAGRAWRAGCAVVAAIGGRQ
jgi:hypothetical protein